MIVSNDTSMGCKWYIKRGETISKRPCSASEDQIGTRQRACIIDASVYMIRPPVTLQGFWREKMLLSFIFSLYVSLTSLFPLSLCLKVPSHYSHSFLDLYNSFQTCQGVVIGLTRPLHQLSAEIFFSWWGYHSVSSFLVSCFHSSPSLPRLCGSLLWMSVYLRHRADLWGQFCRELVKYSEGESEDFIIRSEIWCLCPSIASSVSPSSSLSLSLSLCMFHFLSSSHRHTAGRH